MAPITYCKTKNPKQNHHHNHNNNHRHQQPTTKPNKIDHHSQPQQITFDYHQYQLRPIKNHIKNHNIKNPNITFDYQYPSKIFFSNYQKPKYPYQKNSNMKITFDYGVEPWTPPPRATSQCYLHTLSPAPEPRRLAESSLSKAADTPIYSLAVLHSSSNHPSTNKFAKLPPSTSKTTKRKNRHHQDPLATDPQN